MGKINIFALLMVIVVVSFLGFCIENIFIASFTGFINNRNMILPFLLGYGLSILGILILFGTPHEPKFLTKSLSFKKSSSATIYYFIIAFICVCAGEIALGYIIEYTCDIIWWDYSDLPLNITRYTSVFTSLGFALLITVFTKYIFFPLLNIFSKIKRSKLAAFSIVFIIILSIDMINSLFYMLKYHNLQHIWQINVGKSIKNVFIQSVNNN